jgi:hypothetical protein
VVVTLAERTPVPEPVLLVAAGLAVAELVARGRCVSFDLHPLRPSRFAEGDLVVETAVL